MIIHKCPRCNETENLHFNYDYSKPERPVLDVVCNECGAYFDPPRTINEVLKIKERMNREADPIVSDNFQIGPDGAYEHEPSPSPEDEARRINERFYFSLPNNGSFTGLCNINQRWKEANSCARIAVEEILRSLEYNNWQNKEITKYYQEVKKAIEKI